jgi:hypothetical protein
MVTNQQLLESLIAELKHVPTESDNTDWFKGYMAGRDDARRTIEELLKVNTARKGWMV